jgi:hypothetical protein
MSAVTDLHAAVRQGNLQALRLLLEQDRRLANARSEHGAEVSLLDAENDANALSWTAFFGRPEVTRVLQRFSNATLEDWRRCVELLQRF